MLRRPKDVRRELIPGSPIAEAMDRLPPEVPQETFVLPKGPHEHYTGELADVWFEDGVGRVPLQDADLVAGILCRYYGATRRNEGRNSVWIWGPIDDEAWMAHARAAAQERFPDCSVRYQHPNSFNAEQINAEGVPAIFVVEGCEYIGEPFAEQGVKECITLPGLYHAPGDKETPEEPPTVAPEAPESPPEAPPAPDEGEYSQQPLIDRLVGQGYPQARRSLDNPAISKLLGDPEFSARLIEAEQAGRNRKRLIAAIKAAR